MEGRGRRWSREERVRRGRRRRMGGVRGREKGGG